MKTDNKKLTILNFSKTENIQRLSVVTDSKKKSNEVSDISGDYKNVFDMAY